MNIFYEQSMPYAEAFFKDWGHCHSFNGKTVTPEQLAEADLLLVRSTTRVDRGLLQHNQRLKFVATATAGFDHIDANYLAGRNITWSSAAGCNAVAVAEYVISALFVMAEQLNWDLANKRVGIVGAGNVGTALSNKLLALGVDYLLCDPPLEQAGDSREFHSLEQVLGCDVISLHVPWIKEGEHRTENLIDQDVLSRLGKNQLLINACRGEVIDEDALLDHCQQGDGVNLVLDVWRNEPDINPQLLPYVSLATAHIAGHTNEGKARGTEMVYAAAARELGLSAEKKLSDFLPAPALESVSVEGEIDLSIIGKLVMLQYDIRRDCNHFRNCFKSASDFEYIRQHYIMRREFSALKVKAGNCAGTQALYGLGFSCPPSC